MAYHILNGYETYENQEYNVREVAERLNVTYYMAKKYVHEWKVLPYRLATPRTALVMGSSIVWFASHKQEILRRRRTDIREGRIRALMEDPDAPIDFNA